MDLIKSHMLGADQFIELILTRERNETWNEVDFERREYTTTTTTDGHGGETLGNLSIWS